MNAKQRAVLVFCCAGLAALLLVTAKSVAKSGQPGKQESAQAQSGPIVIREAYHDISLPINEYPDVARPAKLQIMPEFEEPVRPFSPFRPDSVLQDLASKPGPLATATIGKNFDGITNTGFVPPDTNSSVGSTQIVETVNLSYEVFSKTGSKILGPKSISTIFTGLGGCASDGNLSDPVVVYDKAAGRWVISILAFNNFFTQSDECIAVSTTSDATGSYARYDFSFGVNLPDYPKIAVWPDAYYWSANVFPGGGSFVGAEPCAFDRTAMLAGNPATGVCFTPNPNNYSLLPSDLDGATAPPTGQPNVYLQLDGTSFTKLDAFQFHVNFTTPSMSTFTGPTFITIPSWTQLCPGTRACIPEPSPGEKVDSIGNRLMFRLAYRHFSDHEALVSTHTVDKGGKIAGVRWYEIRSPLAPTLFQSGTIANGTINIWMPSIAMDKVGDIAVGFSDANKTTKPGVQFTGRVPGDPIGTMEAISTIVAGTGVQKPGSGNRWGDYSSMAIDPVDDCTFWYSQEYYKTTGIGTWNTRITQLNFSTCH